ncbi:MAG: hypothetical protein IJ299_00115 [Oscillospiraceae bacterium]|nr:hypothetical protein [Oscillospiraceae bacterium]
MMKKIICVVSALLLCLALGACTPAHEEKYISGISFDPADYDTGATARYENKLYGIILEYPEKYQRVGNFDLDGYITFEGDGIAISVYVPDMENNDILTPQEYAETVLGLAESRPAKYGKCSGCKVTEEADGRIRIDFIVKGVDAFYRFAYEAPAEGFTEENADFQSVMSSIRIDDGVYNKLTRMSSRYTVLLEYAKSMQYITDANYANHCLNSFEMSKDERHKNDALSTSANIRAELLKIIEHKRGEDEGYDSMWEEICAEAQEIIDACISAEEAVKSGNYEEAQRIARTEFSYDLADNCSKFIETINAEISEY